MSSREEILSAINKNKPTLSPLPEMETFPREDIDNLAFFKDILEKGSAKIVELKSLNDIPDAVNEIYPDCPNICSALPQLSIGNFDLQKIKDPHELESVDLAIVQGLLGVAENGAIWITDKQMIHRALPFINQHLAIVLKKSDLVWNMHQAYDSPVLKESTDYGVFISGPSKTADIEQSLVIGAHGPRSLTIFLIEDK
ncbi:LutC/YkgG family protein [Flexithrix dorotheae]|uniref:LutC/YkgG family protein n=1 Tax=Flexithrix dorotheae TaxID=70993 RepID=UPI0003A972E4|nr:LUD domain-containing protein [Flexithrix dorotheae]